MEEGVEVEMEAVMAAGDMVVGVFRAILISWTPTRTENINKVNSVDKVKGSEQYMVVIGVAITTPGLAVVLIAEDYGDW